MSRSDAVTRTLTALRFFWESPQGPEAEAVGYNGFYYHFLDMETGRRAGDSEISTIDTTFLLAGALTAAAYFDGDTSEEQEVRELAEQLYRRADWQWALHGGPTVCHGWRSESGFIPYRWQGYSEALLLYMLGLGSPTHPLPPSSYDAWSATYQWRDVYGFTYLYAGPLFIHQLSHVWIDFRGIRDATMRDKGSDYFENSCRATHVQRQYAIDNPRHFKGYSEGAWGITASEGPGWVIAEVDGTEREFFGYYARGAPDGPDDGTLAPWAAVSSLPFAPEIVIATIREFDHLYPEMVHKYGFKCSFNPTFPKQGVGQAGWVSEEYYGLNQGPIVLMIENHRTGMIWDLLRDCSYIVAGLRRAGFAGGWLGSQTDTTA
jgi:hypothetical protein